MQLHKQKYQEMAIIMRSYSDIAIGNPASSLGGNDIHVVVTQQKKR